MAVEKPKIDLTQTNLADGIYLLSDNQKKKATRDRLRTGGPYQPEDTLPWFDEKGDSRFLQIQHINEDRKKLDLLISKPDFTRLVFNTPSPQFQANKGTLPTEELDKFSRGPRADLAILLHQVIYEIGQFTISIPTEILEKAIQTGDWSEMGSLSGVSLKSRLREHIK